MSELADGESSKKLMREVLYGGAVESTSDPLNLSATGTECGDSPSTGQNSSKETAATGIRAPRMLVVLAASELASAIHKACGIDEKKMPVSKFSLETAEKVIKLLPPLYYEPRNER